MNVTHDDLAALDRALAIPVTTMLNVPSPLAGDGTPEPWFAQLVHNLACEQVDFLTSWLQTMLDAPDDQVCVLLLGRLVRWVEDCRLDLVCSGRPADLDDLLCYACIEMAPRLPLQPGQLLCEVMAQTSNLIRDTGEFVVAADAAADLDHALTAALAAVVARTARQLDTPVQRVLARRASGTLPSKLVVSDIS
jgi:hypothetical protein